MGCWRMKMGFEHCHPAVNLIYFAVVLFGMISFQHPIYLLISFMCAFVYSVKRNGRKALIFDLILLPLIGAYVVYYSSYTHFGVTVLKKNLIGNNITLESMIYGATIGLRVAGVMIWFSCVYSVFSTDKVVYLFGKVSPKLSLFLAILLRLIPRIKKEAKKLNSAQRGIGRGVNQGNVIERVRNGLRIFSMLITWVIDSLALTSESMRSRGCTLRGRKAFSIYRFDHRDRLYVIGMFGCITVTMMSQMLQQTQIIYDPRIIINPVTAISYLFYAGYAILCLMPLALELWTEYCFRKARENAFK